MAEYSLLPSHALPDYLKAELRVGEPDAFPLTRALDSFCERLSEVVALAAFDLSAATSSVEFRRRELARLGILTHSLDTMEVDRVYETRASLFETRGTLATAELLASIYFPGSTARLGLPFDRSRMGTGAQVRLCDLSDVSTTVFVRAALDAPDQRCREYLENVAVLLPRPFRAVVALPKRPKAPAVRWCLSVPRSWEKRRVSCLILPR